MRKLLVASQKGGVGKTTTSMNLAAAAARSGTRVLLLDADPLSNISTALNLAEHPQRQSLRQAGIELPGVLVANFVPGLDVLSPYDEGRCSDDDLDRVLRVLSQPVARERYGCMIVDVPPFLGANPAQLIGSCDEFLLVMRAEAMAYRTLPAFLELVQRSSRDGHAIQLRGILLTLPEGEELGCRWERELRGRLGARILSEVIPHDELIGKALSVGQISSHLHPDSPAGHPYSQLVAKLGLADEARPAATAEQVMQALREAALAIPPAVAAAPTSIVADPAPVEAKSDVETLDLFAPATEPEPIKPVTPPVHRARRLSRSGEILRPTRLERPLPPVTPALTPNGRTKSASPPDSGGSGRVCSSATRHGEYSGATLAAVDSARCHPRRRRTISSPFTLLTSLPRRTWRCCHCRRGSAYHGSDAGPFRFVRAGQGTRADPIPRSEEILQPIRG